MSGVNRVYLIGRVGKDVESRNLDNGNQVANFTMATSESYRNKAGEKVEDTTWHNIVLWGKLAEIAQKYVHKGDQIFIEGKLQVRQWEKDGEKRTTTEIVGNNLQLLGSKGSSSNSDNSANTPNSIEDDTNSLPF